MPTYVARQHTLNMIASCKLNESRPRINESCPRISESHVRTNEYILPHSTSFIQDVASEDSCEKQSFKDTF